MCIRDRGTSIWTGRPEYGHCCRREADQRSEDGIVNSHFGYKQSAKRCADSRARVCRGQEKPIGELGRFKSGVGYHILTVIAGKAGEDAEQQDDSQHGGKTVSKRKQ